MDVLQGKDQVEITVESYLVMISVPMVTTGVLTLAFPLV